MFKIIYTTLLFLFLISWYQIGKLPELPEIDERLLQEPIQQTYTNKENFSFSYRQKSYDVKPIADYELWGLVVSQNNIAAWFNYYHDKDSVNLKDVCVIWGSNIKNESYNQKNLKFKSGEWTCYYRWRGELERGFDAHKLSNNHLLTDNAKLQDLIRQVNIGDQIYFRGYLADYREQGSDFLRQTSISRDDDNKSSRSGGACEIVFVDDFKIISHNNLIWNIIYDWSKRLFVLVFFLHVILFFVKNHRHIKDKK